MKFLYSNPLFILLFTWGCETKPDVYQAHILRFNQIIQLMDSHNLQLYNEIDNFANNEVTGHQGLSLIYENSLLLKTETNKLITLIDNIITVETGVQPKEMQNAVLEGNNQSSIDIAKLKELKIAFINHEKSLSGLIFDTVHNENTLLEIRNALTINNWQSVRCLAGNKVGRAELLACLLKLENDLKYAEGTVLAYLLYRFDASSFKFNKLMIVVEPNSMNIPLNGEYIAAIFPGFYDTTSTVSLEIDGKLYKNIGTSFSYNFEVNEKPGKYAKGGFFTFKNLVGMPRKVPFKLEYEVLEKLSTIH